MNRIYGRWRAKELKKINNNTDKMIKNVTGVSKQIQ